MINSSKSFWGLAASRRELKQVTSLFTPREERGAGTGKQVSYMG